MDSGYQRLRNLADSVNDTARIARFNVSLVLIAALYLALTLLSATDENLLRNSIVTLPQLQTGISLKLSYIFAPFVFLYLHAQTLFLLIVLARKVRRFETTLAVVFPEATSEEKTEYRDWLSANSLVQVYRDRSPSTHVARALLWLGTSAVPLILLFLIDLSFMRFQSLEITLIHHICFCADLAAVWLFNRQAVPNRLQLLRPDLRELFRQIRSRRISLALVRKLSQVLGAATKTTVGPCLVALLWIYAWPPTYENLSNNEEKEWYAVVANFNLFDDALCPLSPWRVVCRNLDVSGKTLVRLKEEEGTVEPLDRFDEERAEDLRRRQGIDLERRSLRFAVFVRAWIPHIRLTWADLRGADLSGANAVGANLMRARLDGGKLRGARLNAADLRDVTMNNADLESAKMNGAGLWFAKMNNAKLRKTKLNAVELWWAEMNGADLRDAEMNASDLHDAEMDNAILRRAKISDANLKNVQLNGADLSFVEIHGSSLDRARMNGADLSRAKVNDSDLSGVHMNGVDLTRSSFKGSDLRSVRVNGADLNKAWMDNVDLRNAQMIGAHIGELELYDANLTDAYIIGAEGTPHIDNDTKLGLVKWKITELPKFQDCTEDIVECFSETVPYNLLLRWKPGNSLKDYLLEYNRKEQTVPAWL